MESFEDWYERNQEDIKVVLEGLFQKSQQYKVGDWVQLTKKIPDNWNERMDKFLGAIVQIAVISGNKVEFTRPDTRQWNFWLNAIERKVSLTEVITPGMFVRLTTVLPPDWSEDMSMFLGNIMEIEDIATNQVWFKDKRTHDWEFLPTDITGIVQKEVDFETPIGTWVYVKRDPVYEGKVAQVMEQINGPTNCLNISLGHNPDGGYNTEPRNLRIATSEEIEYREVKVGGEIVRLNRHTLTAGCVKIKFADYSPDLLCRCIDVLNAISVETIHLRGRDVSIDELLHLREMLKDKSDYMDIA